MQGGISIHRCGATAWQIRGKWRTAPTPYHFSHGGQSWQPETAHAPGMTARLLRPRRLYCASRAAGCAGFLPCNGKSLIHRHAWAMLAIWGLRMIDQDMMARV
jgi:hypothetical protein